MIDILQTPDSIEVQTEENNICSDQAMVSFKRTSYGLQVHCESPEERVRFIILRWKGSFSENVKVLGDVWTGFPSYLQWENNFMGKIFSWYFMASLGGEHQGYGVMTQARAMCFWEIRKREIVLYLDVRCGSVGVKLGARRLHAATIVSGKYEKMSSHKAVSLFCRKMCGYAIVPHHPVYGFACCTAAEKKKTEISREAACLAKLTEGMENRPYFWINKNDCPDWKSLAGEFYAMNLNAGIGFRPLLEGAKEASEEMTLHGGRALDPSHPKTLKKVSANVKAMCKEGYSLIIFDGSSVDVFGRTEDEGYPFSVAGDWHFYDQGKTSAEIIMNFYHTIREAAGPYGAVIMGCNAIGHLGTGFMHIQTAETMEEMLHSNNAYLSVNSVAFRLPQHRNFFFIHPGVLTMESVHWEKVRPAVQMIARSGIPLFLAVKNEEQMMTGDVRELFAEASRTHAEMEPVDWEQNGLPSIWEVNGEKIIYEWNY